MEFLTPFYQTFSLLLLQGLPLYADMFWRLLTDSTPDGGFLAITMMVFYALFCFQHPHYTIDVIRMGQTAFYFAEWATATYSLQYWYASDHENVGFIVGYSIFAFFSMAIALALHHDIRTETAYKSISYPPPSINMSQGNIQQASFVPSRPLYVPGESKPVPVEPYQQIV
jgi:hypothetical protein